MKRKTVVLILSCCLVYCTACSGKEVSENAAREVADKENIVETASYEEKTLDNYIEIATMGCRVGKEHEDVQQGNFAKEGLITYRVDKVTLTKKQGDWVDISVGPDLDNQGKIIGDETYVVLDVTVRRDGEFDFWWNSFELSSFLEGDRDTWSIEMTSAGILCSDKNVDLAANNVYQYSLPEGKDVKTSLVFVVEDNQLNEKGQHFLLEFNPAGTVHINLKPEDYSMIFLESMEDRDGVQGSSK